MGRKTARQAEDFQAGALVWKWRRKVSFAFFGLKWEN